MLIITWTQIAYMIDLRSGVVVKTNIIKRRSKSRRKNFVALTVLIRMVLNILFHEVLFIPLLNMEGFLMTTMTKIPIIIMMMIDDDDACKFLSRDSKLLCNKTYIKDDVPKEPL